MKRLWAGDEVTFDGRYTRVERGRMGFRPFQQPHPPLEMGAQSERATRRAARLVDGVFFGPQVAWADVGPWPGCIVRSARCPNRVRARRRIALPDAGHPKEDAARRARAYLTKTFDMYKSWSMQENGMVRLQLDDRIDLEEWTVHGSAADCVEILQRAESEYGLEGVGFTIYSLPPSPEERIEYLQRIAEEIVRPVKALARR